MLNPAGAAWRGCAHGAPSAERRGPGYVLARCQTCGLARVSCGSLWHELSACGECGLFACTCGREPAAV